MKATSYFANCLMKTSESQNCLIADLTLTLAKIDSLSQNHKILLIEDKMDFFRSPSLHLVGNLHICAQCFSIALKFLIYIHYKHE